MRVLRAVAVVLISIPLCLFLAWKLFELWHFVGIIPPSIGLSHPIAINGSTGFREGCGIAVFRIDSSTRRKIRLNGLDFLKEATQSRRDNDPYHTFSQWRLTPNQAFTHDDQTILSPGLECAELNQSLQQQLEAASRTAGSYYAYGPEKVLFVSPELGIVALAYNG